MPIIGMLHVVSVGRAGQRDLCSFLDSRLSDALKHGYVCFLTRSFSNQQPLEELLRREATESHVAPVVVIDPQISG